jgi:two-component SAPR family response regulator
LKTHLLIHLNELSTSAVDSLRKANIPFAFFAEELEQSGPNTTFDLLTGRQNLIPVISSADQEPFAFENNKLVLITPDAFDQVKLEQRSADSLFSKKLFSTKELLWVNTAPTPNNSDLYLTLWSQCGKLPNFIPPNRSTLQESASLVAQLNAKDKFYGVTLANNELLSQVSWRSYPRRISNGYFCFPLLTENPEPFIPYKAGYRFSPDIMHDSPANRGYLKALKAFGLSPDFGLTDHFVFDKKARNIRRNNEGEMINNAVEMTNDPQRGDCAWFPGRAYLDAGIQSKETLQPNFSVTAWIKPTQTDANNSILGKGRDFVLKLHNGQLTYTMQGIKDYRSVSSQVPIDDWTFVSLVHSDYENRMRFYLNGELTDQIDLITPYADSDYTLLIGSNLWEEFFVGHMGDIKIWNRELNDDEIRLQFQESSDQRPSQLGTLWGAILLAVFLLIVSYLYFRRRKAKATQKQAKPVENLAKPAQHQEKIHCFGGLKVINPEGAEVSQKFSPKIKQLFILILLNSVNGQKGISTSKLSGILWPGMSTQNAKNTRGTNIQNLKAALASCPGIKLVYREKLWFMELSENCYFDYGEVDTQLKELEKSAGAPSEEGLHKLLDILSRGTLFPNMSESWLDPYISKMSDRIIEMGMRLFETLDETQHAQQLFKLAEVVSLHDPLNEPALRKKLQLLTHQGKLSLAHTVYDHFAKVYQEMYQESYPNDFKSLTADH